MASPLGAPSKARPGHRQQSFHCKGSVLLIPGNSRIDNDKGGVNDDAIWSNQQKAEHVKLVQDDNVHLGGAIKNQQRLKFPSLGDKSGEELSDLTVGVGSRKSCNKIGSDAVADLVKDSQRLDQQTLLGGFIGAGGRKRQVCWCRQDNGFLTMAVGWHHQWWMVVGWHS